MASIVDTFVLSNKFVGRSEYNVWKFKVTNLLLKEDLLNLVEVASHELFITPSFSKIIITSRGHFPQAPETSGRFSLFSSCFMFDMLRLFLCCSLIQAVYSSCPANPTLKSVS
jgi:hypothetical protein